MSMSHRRPSRRGRHDGRDSSSSSAPRSSDGTTSRTVMPRSPTASSSRTGSVAISSGTSRHAPPASRPERSCHTEMSKLIGAVCATTSDGPSPRERTFANRWLSIPRCSTIAPLGAPVDPDVKMT
ncbi:hypothetical protein BE11_47760 [Sorangium cellulosum]|nr:hypothetical protein BE11_47760 [Sorangium cellulosum]